MACDTIKIETLDADEVVSIVTQGPQGPSGAEAATLTTTGDLLYRAALANDRLPIGSEGQVLKVASGLPAWGNESGAVTSVNGETGAVVLDAADLGAQSALTIGSGGTLAQDLTLTAARNVSYTYNVLFGGPYTITLPIANNQAGDLVEILTGPTFINDVTVRQQNHDGTGGGPQFTTLATIVGGSPHVAQRAVFRKGSASDYGTWQALPASVHTHAAVDITSGTLAHERGGLEADVSAYNGLVKISGGSTSAVGIGTGSTEVAAGDHTHTQLHDRSHAITSTSDHTAGNHKVFYSDGSGQIQELALGNSGEVLTSNGATSAPSFAAASGGVTAVGASTADVLSVSGSDLIANDGGTIDSADPFIKWDDTAGKLVYANPLSRPSGGFYVGLAPTTTPLGTNAINIQSSRTTATNVASNTSCIAIGNNIRVSGDRGIGIGIGLVTGERTVAISGQTQAGGNEAVQIGWAGFARNNKTVSIGANADVAADSACAIGTSVVSNLRSQFNTRTFSSIYWGGQTTNDTPLILNLDAFATNRFTIAANTALAVDILLVARRSDTADKWLVARRFLGIRRDGSNNTSLIGTVQTLGTDQTDGSPTWSFTLTADDTNEALQLEVTGAASETVQWRATAFYRVV